MYLFIIENLHITSAYLSIKWRASYSIKYKESNRKPKKINNQTLVSLYIRMEELIQ